MKKKRALRSKEEVLAQLKGNQDFQKKMEFVREKFYPALIKASRSIDDAQSFISSLSTMMMQKFLEVMKDTKFTDLKLVDILDPKDDKYEALKEMLALFDDQNVFDARELIEGMKSEISLFINEELKDRTLDTLKVKWIDQ